MMPKLAVKCEIILNKGASKDKCTDIKKMKTKIRKQCSKFHKFLNNPTGFIIGIL